MGIIDRIVERICREQASEQERAMEAALQGGLYGISTIHRGLQSVSRVDPRVPYGKQFTFPSVASYQAWINKGAPTS